MSRLTLAASALALTVAATAWAVAGAAGPLYLAWFGVLAGCGLPWGLAVFGPRHAAGWVTGALFGYAVAGFAWWAASASGGSTPPRALAIWSALALASWAVCWLFRGRLPLVHLPSWRRRDTLALLVVLLIVPALVGRPFAQIGHRAPDGSRQYRAYFTADFVWHMALVEELGKGAHPPVDPYQAPETLHYYWTYFLVPAAAAATLPVTAPQALALNALVCGLLFVSSLLLAAWMAVPSRPWLAALAVALVMLCGSVEGVAALAYTWWRGWPLETLRGVNVDALPAWALHGLRIDNLPRALWYTPQHAAAFSLGTIACLISLGGAGIGAGAIVLAGVALAMSVTFNPFVGVVCGVVYVTTIARHALASRRAGSVPRHALVVLPVGLALAWGAANQVTTGSASVLRIGWWGPATHAPLTTFVISFLPAILPAAAALWWGRASLPRAVPALAGVAIGVVVMHTVALEVDPHWVGFRTGHLVFGFLPPLVAVGYDAILAAGRRALAVLMTAGIVLLGLPTTAIDAYNAQDVGFTAMGPGFRWTLSLTAREQEALSWIRTHTRPDAIVQAEPFSRGRDAWSLIPSFAGRRMAAGLPISLMHVPAYDERSRLVREIFATADTPRACGLARALDIDYLYVDGADRAYFQHARKFDRRPGCFETVYRNPQVTVYAIR